MFLQHHQIIQVYQLFIVLQHKDQVREKRGEEKREEREREERRERDERE